MPENLPPYEGGPSWPENRPPEIVVIVVIPVAVPGRALRAGADAMAAMTRLSSDE
jgi:hypothetical protein